jgi:hypothetical protein
MPSWWMPASWAKAFSPTIALLRCTVRPVSVLTMRLAGRSWSRRCACRSCNGRRARAQRHDDLFQRRVAGALADAVDRALDLPRAASTAASELATAMPRSSWQCAGEVMFFADDRQLLIRCEKISP